MSNISEWLDRNSDNGWVCLGTLIDDLKQMPYAQVNRVLDEADAVLDKYDEAWVLIKVTEHGDMKHATLVSLLRGILSEWHQTQLGRTPTRLYDYVKDRGYGVIACWGFDPDTDRVEVEFSVDRTIPTTVQE